MKYTPTPHDLRVLKRKIANVKSPSDPIVESGWVKAILDGNLPYHLSERDIENHGRKAEMALAKSTHDVMAAMDKLPKKRKATVPVEAIRRLIEKWEVELKAKKSQARRHLRDREQTAELCCRHEACYIASHIQELRSLLPK